MYVLSVLWSNFSFVAIWNTLL